MTFPGDFFLAPPDTVSARLGRPAGPLAQRVLQTFERAAPVVRQRVLSQLVVVAFQSASPVVRRHLLERPLRLLGLLSLAAVAGERPRCAGRSRAAGQRLGRCVRGAGDRRFPLDDGVGGRGGTGHGVDAAFPPGPKQ